MNYSKAELGKEMRQELNKGYNIERISNWTAELFYKSNNSNPELDNILRNISLMDAGPEFEYNEQQLKGIANELIDEEKNLLDKVQDSKSKEEMSWIIDWYKSHFQGDWDVLGINLEKMENDIGWDLKINLAGTECGSQPFKPIEIEIDKMNWYTCIKNDSIFEGYCDLYNLSNVLGIFHKWVVVGKS